MKKDFDYLIKEVTDMVMDYYDTCGRPTTTKIAKFAFPPEIEKKLGEIKEEAGTNDECLADIRTTFEYSLKTLHPFFLDKLWASSDPIGQVAELVTAVLNSAVHVYHVSPVYSVMEVNTIQILGKKFGFQEDKIDGTMNPGGTMSNMMALLAARHEHFPHVRLEGWKAGDNPVAFTCAQSHYSINRGAMVSGMGMHQMRQVPAEDSGRMDSVALEKMIKEEIEKGNKPFFVNSVAGTTVLGAYDDHNAISEICKKYGLWHHVDGCWGGFLIFADKEKQRGFMDGIEKVDSVAINPHKGMGIPNQCAVLITNGKKDALRKANTSGAEYLFHESEYSRYDIGDKTLSCGRRPDGLKLWLSMKKHGMQGFKNIANGARDKADYITQRIKEQSDKFQLVREPFAFNVNFWYTPEKYRKGAIYEKEWTFDTIVKTHKEIFERMQKDGTCLIQHNPLTDFDLPNFFRLTLKGEKSRIEDMDYLLEEIDRLGRDICYHDASEAKE